jgi:hypothetical protein
MERVILHGVIRGKSIELQEAPPFSDGDPVTVEIHPQAASGDGIRASAGAWADAGEEFDQWLEDVYQARHSGRRMGRI